MIFGLCSGYSCPGPAVYFTCMGKLPVDEILVKTPIRGVNDRHPQTYSTGAIETETIVNAYDGCTANVHHVIRNCSIESILIEGNRQKKLKNQHSNTSLLFICQKGPCAVKRGKLTRRSLERV